jgi:coenzyme F420-0:L-glutamate ligase / coenzyme F420-1:gamma-L-glutamate ligase
VTAALQIIAVGGLPEIQPGDDLAALIGQAAALRDGDVLVVAQKVVSKAEGALAAARPGESVDEARRRIAREIAGEVVADAPWILIVRTREGFVCANAGIDASNVPGGQLTLLPEDADASARRLRQGLAEQGVDVAVVVADTFGRPWRVGQTDVAIGVAGLQPLRDERGGRDRQGVRLTATQVAVADELAAAADLVRDKAGGVPAVIIRGFAHASTGTASARSLVRDAETDLFRRGAGMLGPALVAPWPDGPVLAPTDHELALARRVAPDLVVADAGPPTAVYADALTAGLAAGVFADLGLAVRWRTDGSRVMLEIGRPTTPR